LDFPIGVVGTSASIGVFGRSGTGPPPFSQGATPFGIFGVSNQQDDSGVGVRGESDAGVGVVGESQSGTGVVGGSQSGIGVAGATESGTGVNGEAGGDAGGGIGVHGRTQGATGIGVFGESDAGDHAAVGVQGNGATGVLGKSAVLGVHGVATSPSGFAGFFDGKVGITRFIEIDEIAIPAAPAANKARLFIQDDGSGKTQLCVRFSTGAAVVLATQA
jgi:hypothetical protein